MSDTEYKTRGLAALQPAYPAIGGLAPLSRMKWAPVGALYKAQDTVPASSRRIVAEWSLNGASDWAQPNGTVDPDAGGAAPQAYPDDTWRTLQSVRAHVTPGCVLRAHVLYCPAGLTQKGPAPWHSDGARAEARVGVTWVNGGSSTGPHYKGITMAGSEAGTYGGLEPAGDAGAWTALQEREIADIMPPGFDASPATAAAYSEWTDARIVLQVRGGARVVHFVVYEVPKLHTTLHSNAGLTSSHSVPPTAQPLTPRPCTKMPDGATYDENRGGSLRMMQVAERQSERLGPRILSWSSWNESSISTITDTENDPITTTSATFVNLFDSSTNYSTGRAGHVVAGAHALLDRLAGPFIAGGRFGVIPVRVRVDASQVGGGTGTIRVQSGTYEIIDVLITGARAVYELTGFLQCQAAADDAAPPLVVFITSGNAARTLSIWNISIDFGHWT